MNRPIEPVTASSAIERSIESILDSFDDAQLKAAMSVLALAAGGLIDLDLDAESRKAIGDYLGDWMMRIHASYDGSDS